MRYIIHLTCWLCALFFPMCISSQTAWQAEEESDSVTVSTPDGEEWENDSIYRSLFPSVIACEADPSIDIPTPSPVPLQTADHVLNSYVPDGMSSYYGFNEAYDITVEGGTTPYGGKTYTIPLELPGGMAGFAPQLALAYNSQGGQGQVGKGWGLSGLSSITRGNKTIYHDGLTAGVSMSADDAFYLDGVRLIQTGTYTYETEQGRIRADAVVSGNVVRYFNVSYPDGRTCVYGFESNTQNRLTYPMTSMEDLCENRIEYAYSLEYNAYAVSEISYNGASIVFSYSTDRTDPITTFSAGNRVYERRLLKSIVCKIGDNTLRTYNLNYLNTTGTTLLTSVRCQGANGYSTNQLAFYYGTGASTYGFDSREIHLPKWYSSANPKMIGTVEGKFDYNNGTDGLIVYPNENPYWYHIESGGHFSHGKNRFDNRYTGNEDIYVYTDLGRDIAQASLAATLKTEKGFVDIFCADIDGQQQEAIIKVNNRVVSGKDNLQFSIYKAGTTGGSVSLYDTAVFNFNTAYKDSDDNWSIQPKHFYAGDFDGDGRMEILAVAVDKPFGGTSLPGMCYVFDLRNKTIRYQGSLLSFSEKFLGNKYTDVDGAENATDKLTVIDYDGDGKSDICHINANGTYIYTFDVNGNALSGRQVSSQTTMRLSTLADRVFLPCEIDGDGLVDFLVSPVKGSQSTAWTAYHSNGAGGFYPVGISGPHVQKDVQHYAHDVNGDGISDIVDNPGNLIDVYALKNGTMNSIGMESTPWDSTKVVMTAISSRNYMASILTLKNGLVTVFTHKQNHALDDLMTGLVRSNGLIEKNEYRFMNRQGNDLYTRASEVEYPFVNLNEDIPVIVAQEFYNDGTPQGYTRMSYQNGIMHRQGRGFMGFSLITTTDARGKLTDNYYAPCDFGQLTKTVSAEGITTLDYDISVENDRRATVLLTSKGQQDLLTGFSSNTAVTYDDYGYPTKEETTFSDGFSKTVETTYQHRDNGSYYKLGTASLVKQTLSNGSDTQVYTEHTQTFTPIMQPRIKYWYTNGQATKEEWYEYDDYGNVTAVDACQYDAPYMETTDYEYDDRGRLTLVSDPMGFETSYTYDELGQVASVTDKYGATTTFLYENYGRVKRETKTGELPKYHSYSWDTSASSPALCETVTQPGHPTEAVLHDAFGREVRRSVVNIDGREVCTDSEYDEYGRLQGVSLPHYSNSSPLWNQYEYDSHDRPVSCTEPSGRTTTYSYSGSEVTTTKDGMATTRTFNSQQQLMSVTDPGGTITYTLDADGKPSQVVAPGGITTTFGYDAARRRTLMDDPSLGSTSYTYDSWGRTSSTTNAKGETITYQYDSDSRLISKSMPEQTFTYTYNSLGDLSAVSSDNGTAKAYAYDAQGRIQSVTAHASDSVWLKKDFAYDITGRLASTAYTSQDGILGTEKYTYKNGWREKVALGQDVIYELSGVNEYGKPEMELLGDIEFEQSYNQYGMVILQTTHYGNHDTIELGYAYDLSTGNLTEYNDYTHNLSETYQYDGMNRLVKYGDKTVDYDDNGNITNKSWCGGYSYTGNTPYAVSKVDGAEGSGTLSFTSFFRPASLNSSLTTHSFVYDENYDRVRMTTSIQKHTIVGATPSTNVTEKYYLGNCYETTGPGGTEWLYLGGDYYTASAVLVKEGSSSAVYHIVRDRLGSIRQIIDGNGNVVCEKDYDAWGYKRVPAGYTFATTLSFDRGYCGHEHVGYYVNMNARLYDPFTGTFISPDPYVQSPDNTQNFNRYSYCLNNPLKYVDRDGEWLTLSTISGFIKGFGKLIKHGKLHAPFTYAYKNFVNDLKVKAGLFKGSWSQIRSRFTKEILQTIAGYIYSNMRLTFSDVSHVRYYGGATYIISTHRSNQWGVTLGSFINIKSHSGVPKIESRFAPWTDGLYIHEYGHYIQSQELGFRYLTKVGIPSLRSAKNAEYDCYYSPFDNRSHRVSDHVFEWYEMDASKKGFEYFSKYHHMTEYFIKKYFSLHPIYDYRYK